MSFMFKRPGHWLQEVSMSATVTKPHLASLVLKQLPPWDKVSDLGFLYWRTNYSARSTRLAFQGSSGFGMFCPIWLTTIFTAPSQPQNAWACISATENACLKACIFSFPYSEYLYPDCYMASSFTSFRFRLKCHFNQTLFLIGFYKTISPGSFNLSFSALVFFV